MPTDWKAMSSVGKGVVEIRLHGQHEHRVLYIAKYSEAIYVLHAFEKKNRLKDLEGFRGMKKEV